MREGIKVHIIAVYSKPTKFLCLWKKIYEEEELCWAMVRLGRNNPLKLFLHPAIYVGYFSTHNQLCGYEHNDIAGNLLLEWMTLNKLHLIFHLKDKATWRKELVMFGSERIDFCVFNIEVKRVNKPIIRNMINWSDIFLSTKIFISKVTTFYLTPVLLIFM
jgi:hypothetical protein